MDTSFSMPGGNPSFDHLHVTWGVALHLLVSVNVSEGRKKRNTLKSQIPHTQI